MDAAGAATMAAGRRRRCRAVGALGDIQDAAADHPLDGCVGNGVTGFDPGGATLLAPGRKGRSHTMANFDGLIVRFAMIIVCRHDRILPV